MLHQLHQFYDTQTEPCKSCLLALSQIILKQDGFITTAIKYGAPFFMYKGKMFCYLRIDKKSKQPYLGIVEGTLVHHQLLVKSTRACMKIMLFNPTKDLPVIIITNVLKQALDLYRNKVI